MEKYTYTGVAADPDYWGEIKPAVDASAMTNKNIQGHGWEEEVTSLYIYFDAALSAGDKTILDGIIAPYQS